MFLCFFCCKNLSMCNTLVKIFQLVTLINRKKDFLLSYAKTSICKLRSSHFANKRINFLRLLSSLDITKISHININVCERVLAECSQSLFLRYIYSLVNMFLYAENDNNNDEYRERRVQKKFIWFTHIIRAI